MAVHEEELAGEELLTARVVVDAEGESAGGVVDGEAVGAVEPHAGPLPHGVVQRRRAANAGVGAVVSSAGAAGRKRNKWPRRRRLRRRLRGRRRVDPARRYRHHAAAGSVGEGRRRHLPIDLARKRQWLARRIDPLVFIYTRES